MNLDPKLRHGFDQAFNLSSLFKMVELIRLDPPSCSFHQQFGIVVFIGEKSVERESDIWSFLDNFTIADFNYFGF